MDSSTNLQMPYLMPSQAQKHVTVNESLRRLDGLVQASAVSRSISEQPADPADGAIYLLPAGKTGAAWDGFTNHAIAYHVDGAWEQIIPRAGWRVWVADEGRLLAWDGTGWTGANPFDQALNAADTPRFSGLVSQADVTIETPSNPTLDIVRTGTGAGAAGRVDFFAPDDSGASQIMGRMDCVVSGDAAGAETSAYRWSLKNGGAFGLGLQLFATDTRFYAPAGTERLRLEAGTLRPAADDDISAGSASFRFSEVFSATGAINTSDARLKTVRGPLDAAERRAARTILSAVCLYQFTDAVAMKGEDGARLHAGLLAQDVAAAFAAEGLDPARYGLFCADAEFETDEAGETRPVIDPETGEPAVRYGLRYAELIVFLLPVLAEALA
ncbi:DUF2793 domain-containing protein [Euryhalocaulis caribicus]|uniref:DUF2793 domain-containing protein n=1 Tax=Euryhalocaulis caribicus TaxID=1161401 RepID=UPI0003A63C6C|nr:DUF2793 domain-containing protein [Euryhalocaulis caribicus]